MVQDDKALLVRLQRHQVEFVIIGGVCGIMHGTTLVTTDLGSGQTTSSHKGKNEAQGGVNHSLSSSLEFR